MNGPSDAFGSEYAWLGYLLKYQVVFNASRHGQSQ